MNRIDGSAKRTVFVRAHIAPLFPEALPPARGAPLQGQAIRFPVSDLCACESDALYEPYNQLGGNKKSFHLSEYFFSSNVKKLFFDTNLFYDASIEHIWYTGMRASPLFEAPNDDASVKAPGTADKTRSSDAADFFVPYRDFDTRARCLYHPDFLIETKQRQFYIVEIADERTVNRRIVRAKREYVESANENADGTRIEYVCIPSHYADMRFEKFIASRGRYADFS
ncbi:hypothetical protein [Treponema sp. Marseille-Q4523]|uniref:hypothetical protein n=1 Tax=Treponema sp. Marseille-Q4523 TaxID=2810610 RepID=UPI00195FF594|nr:hypothetical protein [Treponema sp. Marseille-Q4523]MBM7023334.1 hypothetical protein [Treponema sp. Marseille-Q4523]